MLTQFLVITVAIAEEAYYNTQPLCIYIDCALSCLHPKYTNKYFYITMMSLGDNFL